MIMHKRDETKTNTVAVAFGELPVRGHIAVSPLRMKSANSHVNPRDLRIRGVKARGKDTTVGVSASYA